MPSESVSNSYKLKPCPFCGYEHPTTQLSLCTNLYSIRCENCQSVFRLDCTSGQDSNYNKIKEAWNRRADNVTKDRNCV